MFVGPGFADEHGVVFVGDFAKVLQRAMNLRQFGVVLALRNRGRPNLSVPGFGGLSVRLGSSNKRVDGIEAETGNAALVPEAGDVQHGVVDRGIAPVQVGLLGIEIVVIPLAGFRVVSPAGTAEFGIPVVGRLIVALAVAPDIPVAIFGWCGRSGSRGTICAGRRCG